MLALPHLPANNNSQQRVPPAHGRTTSTHTTHRAQLRASCTTSWTRLAYERTPPFRSQPLSPSLTSTRHTRGRPLLKRAGEREQARTRRVVVSDTFSCGCQLLICVFVCREGAHSKQIDLPTHSLNPTSPLGRGQATSRRSPQTLPPTQHMHMHMHTPVFIAQPAPHSKPDTSSPTSTTHCPRSPARARARPSPAPTPTMERFAHLLEPIRDLTTNWNIDIAHELEE